MVGRRGGTIKATGVRDRILKKIEAAANYSLASERIHRGLGNINEDLSVLEKMRSLKEVDPSLLIPEDKYISMVLSEKERELLLPFFKPNQIDAFYFGDKPAGRLLLKDRGKKETRLFENKRKIIAVDRTSWPRFAWVNAPYYMGDGVRYLDLKDIDPRYAVALLNSSLMWFWFRHFEGWRSKYLRMDPKTIQSVPLRKVTGAVEDVIIKFSNDTYNLKKARRIYLDIWRNYSEFFKGGYKRLYEVLKEDERNRSEGKTERCWTTKVHYHPGAKNPKSFRSLACEAHQKESYFTISGVNQMGERHRLLEMYFGNRKLMLHIYCALQSGNERAKSLREALENTMIPTIHNEGDRGTDYVFEAVSSDFRNFVQTERLVSYEFKPLDGKSAEVPMDIVGVEGRLLATLAVVEALVFGLYGISEAEAKEVLDSLRVDSVLKRKIISTLRQVDLNALTKGKPIDIGELYETIKEEACGHDFVLYSDPALCSLVESRVRALEARTGLHIEIARKN
ncbi:MAG: hypothetical protein FJZ49_06780 [Candidatus Verstraetearchaeota archaeon]|nr:hypothetical protein [Candidatus Verstraetearchaeota archaeon]